jgi:hypothetical protein
VHENELNSHSLKNYRRRGPGAGRNHTDLTHAADQLAWDKTFPKATGDPPEIDLQ